MNQNIVGLVAHKRLTYIPYTLVVGARRSPRVLHHVIFLAVLVVCNAEDLHAVVVGCLPAVVSILAHLLCHLYLRQRPSGQFVLTLVGFQPEPMCHVAAGDLRTVVGIGHNAYSLARKSVLAHIRAPG